MKSRLSDLFDKVKEQEDKHICILMHNYPDADAIASACALKELLRFRDIDADIYYHGRIDRSGTEKLVAMLGMEMKQSDGHFTKTDAMIFVDCQAGTGNTAFDGGICLGCIDHHPTEKGNCTEYLYKQVEETGSCAALITEYIIENHIELSTKIYTGLMFGLEMDTKRFSRDVSKKDVDALGFLLDKVDNQSLHYMETSNLAVSDLKAYGSAITNIRIVADIGSTYVPFDCPDGLIAALAEFMLEIDEISIAIVFSRRSEGVKLSVRSILPFIDAGKFVSASLEGIGSGGGHSMYAGGFIPNESLAGISEEEIRNMLNKAFFREYNKMMYESV